MADLNELIGGLPLDRIAQALGVDEATARSAVEAAIPALAGGMEANAQDDSGAAALRNALQQHEDGIPDGDIDIDGIDTDDGDKIVNHVFGDNREQVTQQLGGIGGLDSGTITKLLPLLAPIVMGFIAKQMRAKSGGDSGGGGDLTDVLGGLVGGAGGGGGGLLDMLGGLFGKK